jgi:hypothetical protein
VRIPFQDLFDIPEDERIAKIVAHAKLHPQQKVGFFTDDEPGKPERYIEKIRAQLPDAHITGPTKGPVPGVVICTVTWRVQ